MELSVHWPDKDPLQIQQISENQEIPKRYLVQILIQLKGLGLVTSSRGKEGGYNLAKPPEDIRLGEVMRNVGGPFLGIANSALKKESVFVGIWREVEDVMSNVLDKVSFADICGKLKRKEKIITYQI
ncbi:MAG: Rrf2 family transcriptional regulator [Candidatus Omnitrophica bacterium]|nr:Rrf2 family transcriptional regulator [Candidatus Omnitrophota bacterium]MBU1128058.1 Rrf2 family transcriptional regulator [Candidatus Omnitrophota bacterium]MBU1851057.1 Rrf2 family transcriptional regulator [Candidatus Omnitrophota bacterium]